MHAFSAAGAEKEVHGGRNPPHPALPLPQFFSFPSLLSSSPAAFLSPSLLSVSLCLTLSSYISSTCSVGSYAVLCEASYQHQQRDRAEPVSFGSKATQQREIDGLCSQMRSASLHFVCV